MRDHYTLSAEESLSALQTNECGLSAEEAEKRLKTYGRNELRRKKKKGPLRLFLAQFTDFMTKNRVQILDSSIVRDENGSTSYDLSIRAPHDVTMRGVQRLLEMSDVHSVSCRPES